MPGNGYWDSSARQYLPKSQETWDDYDASSATVDWDSWTSWAGTPNLPLTWTTEIFDYGRIDTINYLVTVDSTVPASITVRYGDTVDSSGGAIDNVQTISVSPNQTGLTARRARYFQYVISLDYEDSSGTGIIPVLNNVSAELSSRILSENRSDIDSSTLPGSVGQRQLALDSDISTVVSAITQPQISIETYVSDSYVASGYVETTTTSTTPVIYVDKSTTPITLFIYDLDSYGKRRQVDCVFDAILTGTPAMASDATGSIREGI